MQSSDFGPIVSPVGVLSKTKKAKGGKVKKTAPHHLLIMIMPAPSVSGALGRDAGIPPKKSAR